MIKLLMFTLSFAVAAAAGAEERRVVAERPPVFVDAKEIVPSLRVDAMYYGPDNFVGRRIRGYEENRCLLVRPAALALKRASERLERIAKARRRRLALYARDCYRPQKAVDDFLTWVADPADQKQKARFYPGISKPEIVSQGYLATFSGHSRGATIDLTIAELNGAGEARELDMGAPVDFFGEISHTAYPQLKPAARANRRLLLRVMAPDFANYKQEWWHYTLKDEPFPNTAFDFDVRSAGAD